MKVTVEVEEYVHEMGKKYALLEIIGRGEGVKVLMPIDNKAIEVHLDGRKFRLAIDNLVAAIMAASFEVMAA